MTEERIDPSKCEGCQNELLSQMDKDTGYCLECREAALGFDTRELWRRPRHNEMKDRKQDTSYVSKEKMPDMEL